MRAWLKSIYQSIFFPAISELNNTKEYQETAAQWSEWMKQQWANHGLTSLNQQKNPMTEVSRAVKDQLPPDQGKIWV